MEADPVLGPYFDGLDWEVHLPEMIRFWSSVVFVTELSRSAMPQG